MQFYCDPALYFRVLPRDLIVGYLRRFCFDYRLLTHYLTIPKTGGDIAFDLDGNVMIPRWLKKQVRVYSGRDGALLRKIEVLSHPRACAVDNRGWTYVADEHGVSVFQPDGSLETTLDVGSFPYGVSARGAEVFVRTYFGLAVIRECSVVEQIHTVKCGVSALAVVPSTGQLVVCSGESLLLAERTGVCVCMFSEMRYPMQIALDADDNIFVVDTTTALFLQRMAS